VLEETVDARFHDKPRISHGSDVEYLIQWARLREHETLTTGQTALGKDGIPISVTEAVEPRKDENSIKSLRETDRSPNFSTQLVPRQNVSHQWGTLL
jgi:hypothetical protein